MELKERFKGVFAPSLNGNTLNSQPASLTVYSRRPIAVKAKRYSEEERIVLEKQITRLLKDKIIEPSYSPYASNPRLIPKKNGKRLVVNYIPLNRILVPDNYSLPLITEIFDSLVGSKVYSTLDTTEGFHQVDLDKELRKYTALRTPTGLYQYCRVAFGLSTAPFIFQRKINEVLRPGLFKRCVAYVDDILVFGQTQSEHDDNLNWVLSRCEHYNLKMNPAKCQLSKDKVAFLGSH